MHELSVCQALIAQVERIAAAHRADRVERIVLAMGPLSGVEPRLLARAFPLAAAGTPVEGATLEIENTSVRVCCSACGAESEVAANRLLCGACGDFRTRLLSGDEMVLQRLEFCRAAPRDDRVLSATA